MVQEKKQLVIGDIRHINKNGLTYLDLGIPTTTDELETGMIQFRRRRTGVKEFSIEGDVIQCPLLSITEIEDPAI